MVCALDECAAVAERAAAAAAIHFTADFTGRVEFIAFGARALHNGDDAGEIAAAALHGVGGTWTIEIIADVFAERDGWRWGWSRWCVGIGWLAWSVSSVPECSIIWPRVTKRLQMRRLSAIMDRAPECSNGWFTWAFFRGSCHVS